MTHRFLPLLFPMRPGKIFAGRFLLHDVRGQECVVLEFSDALAEKRFQVRITPKINATESWLTEGPLAYALGAKGNCSVEMERVLKAVVELVRQNRQGRQDSDVLELFLKEPGASALTGGVQEKRVEILVGQVCPSNCLFCSDRIKINCGGSFEEIAAELRRCREEGFDVVEFGGLEPTTQPRFPEMVALARSLGYLSIQVVSNGWRFAEMDYFRRVFESGLNVLVLSIHAACADTEERITRSPRLFERKKRTMENALKILGNKAQQVERGRLWRTNTTLTKANIGEIPELVGMLEDYEPSLISLNYPWVNDIAMMQHFAEVAPRYSDLAKALEPLRGRLKNPQNSIALSNLPPCIGDKFGAVQLLAKNVSTDAAWGRKLDEKHKTVKPLVLDPTLVHGEICRSCALRGRCLGISRYYLEHYGEDDLGLPS